MNRAMLRTAGELAAALGAAAAHLTRAACVVLAAQLAQLAQVARLPKVAGAARSPTLFALLAACALALTACGGAKPVKPTDAHAQLIVSGDVNPDNSGRASPIVVRLFQLRNDGEFATADFFALYDKEKETLGASFISREEYVLNPGETRVLELAVNPDARFIGALAAYRDIRSAQWRALTRPPEKKLMDLLGKRVLVLTVGKDNLTLGVKD
jgi:type VI secretion system protein VasD